MTGQKKQQQQPPKKNAPHFLPMNMKKTKITKTFYLKKNEGKPLNKKPISVSFVTPKSHKLVSNKDFLVIWCYHRWVALFFGRSIGRSDPIIRSTQPHLEDLARGSSHPSINGCNQPTNQRCHIFVEKKTRDGKGFTVFCCPKKKLESDFFFTKLTVLWLFNTWRCMTWRNVVCLELYYFNPFIPILFCQISTSWGIYTLQSDTSVSTPLFPGTKNTGPKRWDLQIGEGWQCRERIGDIQDHAVPREAIASWEKWRGKRRCHQRLADVLQRWSCCFFLSAILTYTNRCRTVHSDKESSWKIPSNSGICRGWLHFTNPKSGQFGRFPDSKPTFFEASLQQTQMLHNFSKHSWNKQFSGESIRVFKIPAPSFHRWWPRNSTPRPCIGSIWDLEGKEFIRPLEEIPKQPPFGCIKPRNNGTFTISTGAGIFFPSTVCFEKVAAWNFSHSSWPTKKMDVSVLGFHKQEWCGEEKKNHLVKLCSPHL